jgi:di/tricarboxylate transporter
MATPRCSQRRERELPQCQDVAGKRRVFLQVSAIGQIAAALLTPVDGAEAPAEPAEPAAGGEEPPCPRGDGRPLPRRFPGSGVALLGGAFLLFTRRVKTEKVYFDVDWPLLVMFAGLFVVVAGFDKAVIGSDAHASRSGRISASARR